MICMVELVYSNKYLDANQIEFILKAPPWNLLLRFKVAVREFLKT